jgi:hypothetical protein
MKTKQCEVIQDLLPLYIDNVCSEESRRMVSEHLESCDECKSLYDNMIESVKQDLEEPKLDSQQAFSAINRKWKMKKISIISISVVLTALVVFIGYMIVQNVSSVHDYFFPVTYAHLRELPNDEWQRVSFKDTDVLVFDSTFYDKEVTLDGNGDGAISIRILDRIGNIVVGETVVEPGTSLKLDALQSNTEYVVEVKTTADFVLLNFH